MTGQEGVDMIWWPPYITQEAGADVHVMVSLHSDTNPGQWCNKHSVQTDRYMFLMLVANVVVIRLYLVRIRPAISLTNVVISV